MWIEARHQRWLYSTYTIISSIPLLLQQNMKPKNHGQNNSQNEKHNLCFCRGRTEQPNTKTCNKQKKKPKFRQFKSQKFPEFQRYWQKTNLKLLQRKPSTLAVQVHHCFQKNGKFQYTHKKKSAKKVKGMNFDKQKTNSTSKQLHPDTQINQKQKYTPNSSWNFFFF